MTTSFRFSKLTKKFKNRIFAIINNNNLQMQNCLIQQASNARYAVEE